MTCQQLAGGRLVVGGFSRGLQVIDRIEQQVQLATALDRLQVARLVAGKRAQPYGIALSQGNVAQQQAGIERVVKMGQFIILAAHVLAAIEHEHDLLVALILVFPGNGRSLAGGGFPVDLTQAVAFTKLAQLVKLQAQSSPLMLAHAQLAQPVIHTP